MVEPVRTDGKLHVGQLQSMLREARGAEDFSLAGDVNKEWERGLLWSVLLGKSEGRLREMWEIMDGFDGRIRLQCDVRLTELLQTCGRCVHFGGMDGTGRLGKSLTTSLRRNARSSRHTFTVSVALKAEEDNEKIKQGKTACAGWKLKHAEEITLFRRDVAPEDGVKKGGGQKID